MNPILRFIDWLIRSTATSLAGCLLPSRSPPGIWGRAPGGRRCRATTSLFG